MLRGPSFKICLIALLSPALLAGCASSDSDGPEAGEPRDGAGRTGRDAAPDGCGARTSVAHHPGAIAIASGAASPVACMSRTGFASLEPTLGVGTNGTLVLYPAVTDEGFQMARSLDGGSTWEAVVPRVAGEGVRMTTLDPYLYLDQATGRIFVDDLITVNCSVVSWTDDVGETWDHSVAGCMETDHQTLFAGPPVTSVTVGYPNVLYRCAINAGVAADASLGATCQRSIDGGRTWLPPSEPAFGPNPEGEGRSHLPGYCDGATGHVFVDEEGTVYLPKGWCGEPWLAISRDEGLTWTRVQVADNGMARNARGFVAHEAGVAVDAAGNVFYAWVAEDRLPYVTVSRDGGRTWREPMMVGPPDLTQATLPALIAGGPGGFAVAYLGSTNAPGAPHPDGDCLNDPTGACPFFSLRDDSRDFRNVTWNGYITMTVDGDAPQPTLFTAPVNDPQEPLVVGRCDILRCQEVYDFIDVRIAPDGTPFASFVDGCSSSLTTRVPDDGDLGEGVVGWLWGGPSLWGAAGAG